MNDGEIGFITFVLIICLFLGGIFLLRQTIGLRFLDEIQIDAPTFLKENGFEYVGCQGFQTCLFQGSAAVWFMVKRDNLIYECAITKRRGRYQLYSLEVKNAVNISVKE